MHDDPSDRLAALEALAARHGVSAEATRHMLHALEAGGGTMAQFDHPEFGGMGQWFANGMVMVGRMNDHGLKARVSALCADLAAALPAAGWGGPGFSGGAASSQSQSQSSGFAGFESGSGRWWPDGLGRPSSVGSQNATRYAFFPESRRLAVETNGRVALYDTAEHVITGASQQQAGSSAFRFSGPQGTIGLDGLRRVDPPAEHGRRAPEPVREPPRADPPSAPPPPQTDPSHAAPAQARPQASHGQDSHGQASPGQAPLGQPDILSTLERLAELHRKGVLTDDEFSRKKAELLARL